MSNMRIWDAVPKTDRSYTQNANVDGNRQTAVSGLYMVKLATEVLGPIGEGWGFSVVEERFDNTAPMVVKAGNDKEMPVYMMDNGAIVWEQVHTLKLRLWHGAKENTVEQYGHTPYRYMTKTGKVYCDKEYAKKSLTDALKKCLSLLGICADVYMGMFDDQAYVAAADTENALKKADNADAELMKQIDAFRAEVADSVKAIGLAPNMDAVGKLFGLAANKIDRKAAVLGLNADAEKEPINVAYFERERVLKGSQE